VNPLPLVAGELRRNAAAACTIGLLIALAVALGLAVTAQERALREAASRAADRFDLIVGAPGSATQLVLTTIYLQHAPLPLLPPGTLAQVARLPGVADAVPVIVADSFRGYPVVGTDAAFAGSAGLREGRMFAAPNEAVVGAEVALSRSSAVRPQHGSPGENVLEAHDHDLALTVVGRLAPQGTPWDRAIVVPVEAILEMHERGGEGAAAPFPAIVVKPRGVVDAYRLRAQLRTQGMLAVFPAEVLIPMYRALGDARELVEWMARGYQGIVLAAIVLALVAVVSLRRESLGVLRALGAPPAYVFLAIFLQCIALMAAGIAAGAPLALLLCRALSALVAARTGLAVDSGLGWPEVRLLLELLAVASLLSALPSLLALRLSALRLLRAG